MTYLSLNSCGNSSGSMAVPTNEPNVSQSKVPVGSTAGILEYARKRGFLKQPPTSIKRLPQDAILHATEYLNPSCAMKFSRTCKEFHNLKIGPTIKSLYRVGENLTVEKLQGILKVFPNLQELHLDGCALKEDALQLLTSLKDQLTKLTLKFDLPAFMDKALIEELGMKLPGGGIIFWDYGSVGERVLSPLANLSQLKSFTLSLHYESEWLAKITLKIIKLFASKMPELKELVIQDWEISTKAMKSLSLFTKLEILDLTGKTGKVTKEVLDAFATLTNLKKIRLDRSSIQAIGETVVRESLPGVLVEIREDISDDDEAYYDNSDSDDSVTYYDGSDHDDAGIYYDSDSEIGTSAIEYEYEGNGVVETSDGDESSDIENDSDDE